MTETTQKNFSALCKKSYEIKFDLEGSKYEPIENIGSGAYGVVCSAVNKKNKEKVAIKKIPSIFDQPTIAKRTYREIKILKHFKHDNIIAIREILQPKMGQEELKDVYIVLDLMESDLHRIIHSKQDLSNEHVKYFLYQLLRGLKYIHSANVIHRDLKPSNLLVNANCELKIGDFGMARGLSSGVDTNNAFMTLYVATRWYRAPELMMSFVQYTLSVDIWSVGCIFAEMLGRKQIFPGKDAIHQMALIFSILGTPKADVFKTKSEILHGLIKRMGCKIPIPLEKQYPYADKKAIDLLSKMLQLDPSKRITAEEALKHPYLSKYHDETDEPVCIPAFDFGFEKEDMSLGKVKESILKEVSDYKKSKPFVGIGGNKPQIPDSNIPGNFTTVLPGNFATVAPGNFTTVIPGNFTVVKGKNVEGSSKNIPGSFSNIAPGSFSTVKKNVDGQTEKFPGSFSRSVPGSFSSTVPGSFSTVKKSVDGQTEKFPGSFTKSTNKENSVTFKKPIPGTLSVAKKEKNENTENDVVMLSAKLEESVFKKPIVQKPTTCQTKIPASSDVDMLSAKIEEPKEEGESQKTLDTKALLKASILKAGLRKKAAENHENSLKQRPVTAVSRHKEREEKRKKKMEKAKLRKKKQKKKEIKVIELSDADKSLLEKWSSMQQKPKTVCDDENTEKQKSALVKEEGNILQIVNANTQSSENKNCLQNSANGVLQTASIKTEGLQTNQSCALLASEASQSQTVPSDTKVSVDYGKIETDLTGTVLTNPLDSQTLTRKESDENLQNSNPQITIWDTSSSVSPKVVNSYGRLPSYSEALQAKGHYIQPEQGDPTQIPNQYVPQGLSSTASYFDTTTTFGQTYQPTEQSSTFDHRHPSTSNEDSLSPIRLPFLSPHSDSISQSNIALSPSDLAMGNVNNGHDLLSVVTRKMSKSHVDDLTLALTPMGTGDGYGVGMDLDELLDGDMLPERKMDSAPISAGLYQDWLDVINIDPNEMNDMVKEIGMSSPLVF